MPTCTSHFGALESQKKKKTPFAEGITKLSLRSKRGVVVRPLFSPIISLLAIPCSNGWISMIFVGFEYLSEMV